MTKRAETPLDAVAHAARSELIRDTLQRVGGNVTRAARELQITEQTMHRLLERYGFREEAAQLRDGDRRWKAHVRGRATGATDLRGAAAGPGLPPLPPLPDVGASGKGKG